MICNVCNKRRAYTGAQVDPAPAGSQMCNYCFEEGSQENSHSDYRHDEINSLVAKGGDLPEWVQNELSTMEHCWICHPELNLAQKATGKKVQDQRNSSVAGFTRRPQLNHKGHHHPQTPAARRECKKAFWATVAEAGVKKEETLAMMMKSWDIRLDGHGKLIGSMATQPKAAKWHVAPLGPKGGTGASVKAAGEQVKTSNAVAKGLGKVFASK